MMKNVIENYVLMEVRVKKSSHSSSHIELKKKKQNQLHSEKDLFLKFHHSEVKEGVICFLKVKKNSHSSSDIKLKKKKQNQLHPEIDLFLKFHHSAVKEGIMCFLQKDVICFLLRDDDG